MVAVVMVVAHMHSVLHRVRNVFHSMLDCVKGGAHPLEMMVEELSYTRFRRRQVVVDTSGRQT
jgi:hypothetical protein